ncbi:MAG: glycosyltransferase [Oscillospiraceae bacterium]|jgi:glycosyltransferase involved in cell wall biosynthesis|nr:glycosyltransferase [Oscillospiraceae bacterium]
MKLLYIGTACREDAYKKLLSRCRVKPSVAPFVFETALLQGFRAQNAALSALAFPMLAAFPASPLLAWGARRETLVDHYPCTWIPAVNIKGLKQFSQRISARKLIKKHLKESKGEDCAVLLSSIYEPVAYNALRLCSKYGAPCFAIVPDLPRDMYANQKSGKIKQALSRRYVKKATALQGEFDGYIYLTEAMKEEINPAAPYIVVEAIADIHTFEEVPVQPKKKAIMYAGSLNEKFGIANLIEAFLQFDNPEWELWIFGAGDYVNQVEAAAKACPAISYFGRVEREEVLKREREASLLVNPRPTDEAYTRFSFPSKTVEYMLSGTPLLTTRLQGIPEPYFAHVFSAADNRPESLAACLREIASRSPEELAQFARGAQAFVAQRCSAARQAQRILEFMCAQHE